MSLWHLLLYVAAAIFALRSFIQLVTNYRSEFEKQVVADELRNQAEAMREQAARSAESQPEPSDHR